MMEYLDNTPKLKFGWKNRDFALVRCFWLVGLEVDDVPRIHFFPFVWDFSLDLNLPISTCNLGFIDESIGGTLIHTCVYFGLKFR